MSPGSRQARGRNERAPLGKAGAPASRTPGTAAGVLELMPEGYARIDREWRFVELNAEGARLLSTTRDAVIGRSMWEAFPDSRESEIEEMYRRVADERIALDFETHYAPLNRWFGSKLYPTEDGGVGVFFSDITERKRNELLESAHREVLELIASGASLPRVLTAIAQLVEQHEDGLKCSILLVDDHGEHTGSGHGASLPRAFLDALSGIVIAPPYIGSCCRALYEGEDVQVPDVASDTRWSDAWRDLNLSYGLRTCRSVPVRGPGGEVMASIAVFRQVAGDTGPQDPELLELAVHLAGIAIDRDRSSAALQRGADRLRLLWESAALLLGTTDPRSVLGSVFERFAGHAGLDVYFNHMVTPDGQRLQLASCGGVPEAAVAALQYVDFGEAVCGRVAQRREAMLVCDIQRSDDPGVQVVRELGMRAYACHPLLAGDQLLGTLSFASGSRDRFSAEEMDLLQNLCQQVAAAYERLRLIERLREDDRRKDEFLATLAHELRNPLAPISSGLQMLQLRGDDAGLRAHARAIMERQLAHMVRLVDDLLDVSRISRGKVTLRTAPVDLCRVLQQAVEGAQPLIDASRHVLDFQCPPEPLVIDADATRIAQVIGNLLSNACKYTPPGGRIDLRAERDGDAARIVVRDSGIGIPAEMLPRVFEMFTQVDRSLERAQGGLGIGLSLVEGLVRLHGGSVEAHSAGSNQGSEFVVRLPLIGAAHAELPAMDAPQAATRSEKLRILVVDDNREAADSLSLLLRLSGHDIRTSYDGLAALEAAEAFRPELVLLDVGMPRLNGYEAARRIRARPWGDQVVLVALTGWGREHDRRRSQASGFDHHLTKPADPAALQALLAGVRCADAAAVQ